MEPIFGGIKVSVILAAFVGAGWRVFRMKPEGKSILATTIRYFFTFLISAVFALLLLQPTMFLFGIPVAYEVFVAMLLALSADVILNKVLAFVNSVDLANYIEGFLKAKGFNKQKKEDDNES